MSNPNASRSIWRPFSAPRPERDFPRVRAGDGAYLHLEDGRRILDAISSWWVITFGHCYPPVMRAIAEQAQLLDQVIFAEFSHAPAEELADLLIAHAPIGMSRVFFSDNGSTAVEIALKMALHAQQLRGEGKRTAFLSFKHGYHGDTIGAMSVSGRGKFTAPYGDLLFQALQAGQGRYSTETAETFVADARRILFQQGKTVAAVVIEPLLQGAAGMVVWPEGAVKEIAELAHQVGAMLICDEVMTGFGRTSSLFASEQLGIRPDFLCLSKGLTAGSLPLAVTMTTDGVAGLFEDAGSSGIFFHGHSFTANPLACAAAVASVAECASGKWHARWAEMSALHRARAAHVRGKSGIRDVRVCGTVAAIEWESPSRGYFAGQGQELSRFALERGILLRPLGNVIYTVPPYCTGDEELHRIWDVMEAAVIHIGKQ